MDEHLRQAAIANAQQDADLYWQNEDKNLHRDAIQLQAQINAGRYREPMSNEEWRVYVRAWVECYEAHVAFYE